MMTAHINFLPVIAHKLGYDKKDINFPLGFIEKHSDIANRDRITEG